MSDIVERLREPTIEVITSDPEKLVEKIMRERREAAGEIERLRKCLRIAKRDMMATDLSRQRLKKANA